MKIYFVLILFLTFTIRAESTILCVGDSITAGSNRFNAYRFPLAKLLKEAGYKFQFIGSQENSEGGLKLRHDGYGGKNTQFLKENISRIYKANPADFVLIHTGHNNFAKDKPVPGIVSDTKEIIGLIQKINPKVVILIAQIIPSGKLPKYSYISKLNSELKKLSVEPYIMTVNVAASFDWRTDTVVDKVHPNKQGAEKMARNWFDALRAFPDRFK